MIKNLLWVGIGGFLGSISRHYLGLLLAKLYPVLFPVGTFTINILGSFLIGLLYGLTEKHSPLAPIRLLLATGFCGGFTTFSSFSAENFAFLEKGEWEIATIYSMSSFTFGILFVFLGIKLGKLFSII